MQTRYQILLLSYAFKKAITDVIHSGHASVNSNSHFKSQDVENVGALCLLAEAVEV